MVVRIRDTMLEAARAEGERGRIRSGATGPRAYASEAGGCGRKIAYDISAGRPGWETTLVQEIAFAIGRTLEALALEALRLQVPAMTAQVPWVTEDGLVSGRADATYPGEGGALTTVEVKSMAASYFKEALAKGPEHEHILQCAVSALVLGAPWCHLVYVNKNSGRDAQPVLEWVFETPVEEATRALDDLRRAAVAGARSEVAPPVYGGLVIAYPDPSRKPCVYCDHTTRCAADGYYPEESHLGPAVRSV